MMNPAMMDNNMGMGFGGMGSGMGGNGMVPPPVGSVIWMQKPNPIPGVPPGLEYLSQVDQIYVQQIPNMLENLTGFEMNSKYRLRNAQGQQCYYAYEDTSMCQRQCCGPQRKFDITLVDNMNQQVAKIYRPFKCCGGHHCCAGCCGCCAHEVTIEAPIGTIIGYARESGSISRPKYGIYDENHEKVLNVIGPKCICNSAMCPTDNKFKITSLDGETEVGNVTEFYSGFFQEMFTSAENFGASFPADLNVKTKASILGVLFLIDFMFFEKKKTQGTGRY